MFENVEIVFQRITYEKTVHLNDGDPYGGYH